MLWNKSLLSERGAITDHCSVDHARVSSVNMKFVFPILLDGLSLKCDFSLNFIIRPYWTGFREAMSSPTLEEGRHMINFILDKVETWKITEGRKNK